MNRRNQILAGLLVAQVIIGLLVVALPSQAAAPAFKPMLEQLSAADITGLTIREQPDKQIRMVKQDGAWVLPDIEGFPVNESKVNDLLDKLLSIQVGKPVATTAASHARLQVAENNFTRRVDLTTGKGERTLFFGNARGGSSHVRAGDAGDVYLTTKLATFDIASDLPSWINTLYFTTTQPAVGNVALTNITGTLTFRRASTDTWTLDGLAAGETFKPDRLDTILSRLSSLYMARPLGKTARPEYGLDKPTATITLTLKSDLSSLKPLVLKIGAKDEKDNTYVVKSSESPWYVKVNSFNVEDIVNARREDFLAPPPTATPEATATPTP